MPTDVIGRWGDEQLGAHIITDTDGGADQQSQLLLGRVEEEACWAPQARYSASHPPALLLPHRILYTLGRSGQVSERCTCVWSMWTRRCDAHSGWPWRGCKIYRVPREGRFSVSTSPLRSPEMLSPPR